MPEISYLLGGERSNTDPQGEVLLPVSLLPTPDATHSRKYTRTSVLLPGLVEQGKLLRTPGASDGDRGGPQHPDKRRAGGHQPNLQDQACFCCRHHCRVRPGTAARVSTAPAATPC